MGVRKTAIDYEKVNADLRLDFKFTTGSALSDFIIMCLVNDIRKKIPNINLSYNGLYRYKESKPANSFVLFDNDSKAELSNLIRGRAYTLNYDKLLMDYDMIEHIKNEASECGYKRLYLETHTNLPAAIHMYEKTGFREIERLPGCVHSTMNRFYLAEL